MTQSLRHDVISWLTNNNFKTNKDRHSNYDKFDLNIVWGHFDQVTLDLCVIQRQTVYHNDIWTDSVCNMVWTKLKGQFDQYPSKGQIIKLYNGNRLKGVSSFKNMPPKRYSKKVNKFWGYYGYTFMRKCTAPTGQYHCYNCKEGIDKKISSKTLL